MWKKKTKQAPLGDVASTEARSYECVTIIEIGGALLPLRNRSLFAPKRRQIAVSRARVISREYGNGGSAPRDEETETSAAAVVRGTPIVRCSGNISRASRYKTAEPLLMECAESARRQSRKDATQSFSPYMVRRRRRRRRVPATISENASAAQVTENRYVSIPPI